jgi:hypothetical protein
MASSPPLKPTFWSLLQPVELYAVRPHRYHCALGPGKAGPDTQRLLGDERRFPLFHRPVAIRMRTRLWTLPPIARDRNEELPFICDFPSVVVSFTDAFFFFPSVVIAWRGPWSQGGTRRSSRPVVSAMTLQNQRYDSVAQLLERLLGIGF